MSATELQPIWEVPEVIAKVAAVKKYIVRMVQTRNLFAWREFVHDLQVDIEMEIYKYEELHRQGKYKETGIGAYCNMAVQGALNWSFYYSAQKRKLNHEAISLDALTETEDGTMPRNFPAAHDDTIQCVELLTFIEQELGDSIRKLVERVLNGEQLSKVELNKLKTADMKDLLTAVYF